VLDPLYILVTRIILWIHGVLAPVFGTDSGWSWGLAIVLLVVLMRLVLFPLFVKQIKAQRAMQVVQPQIKALQQKYKHDPQKRNEELMRVYKESGANPLTGCLPLVAQLPIFYALFHVLRVIAEKHVHYGLTEKLVNSAANAKIFGAPIAASFKSSAHQLAQLHASGTTVRIVCVVMIILMAASTFLTQRQMMIRNQAMTDNPIAQQQKIMLYVIPPFFALSGAFFPIGVLLYWVTTNAWTLGQQHIILRHMQEKDAATAEKLRTQREEERAALAEQTVRQQPVNARNRKSRSRGKKSGRR
jgi:YidC/Oxa1 family membrane protein insertase